MRREQTDGNYINSSSHRGGTVEAALVLHLLGGVGWRLVLCVVVLCLWWPSSLPVLVLVLCVVIVIVLVPWLLLFSDGRRGSDWSIL